MKTLTLKFDDYKVTRDTNGFIRCFCPCGGQIKNQGASKKHCTSKCGKRLPKDIDSALDSMGYYLQDSVVNPFEDNIGELLKHVYSKQFIEQMQNLSSPIYDMLAKELDIDKGTYFKVDKDEKTDT